MMEKSNARALDAIVSSVYEVYNILRNGTPLDHEGKGLHFLHWNQKMDDQQQQARSLIDNSVVLIEKVNPMISERLIREKLIYRTVGHALWFPRDVEDVRSFIEQSIKELIDYEANREIDIPVIYLDPGNRPLKFGLVMFYKIKQKDKKDKWWESIKNIVGSDVDFEVVSYARISSLGDHQKSLDNADRTIDETLTFLRAVGFPITARPQLQFGVVNDYALSQVRPYRIGPPTENYKLEGASQLSWRTGPGIAPYNIRRDLLSTINRSTLSALQKLIENDFLRPTSAIKEKFFLGLHWLGEATKPDTPESKFVKLTFSLESFIGGEASNDALNSLSTRGITATLAERGAFIAGKNPKERRDIHDAIHKFYGSRSGIVHGGVKEITEESLNNFSSLVRKIAWALLHNLDKFSDVKSMQEWIFGQRYS